MTIVRCVPLIAASLLVLAGNADARPRSVQPPVSAPIPPVRPDVPDVRLAPIVPDEKPVFESDEIPVPESRPEPEQKQPAPETTTQEMPSPKPAIRESVGRHNARAYQTAEDPQKRAAEDACQQELRSIGVIFEAQAPISEAAGCKIAAPLSVSALGSGISLQPAGVMNCAMADTTAKFARSVISPLAKSIYGSELATMANASTYVCRPRNGTSKLSEHAFGNALDIARFTLVDGRAIDVAATEDEKDRKFLDGIRKAACGPFKTVLGPGSDADHATHFHLDLAPRHNGGTFCQ